MVKALGKVLEEGTPQVQNFGGIKLFHNIGVVA